MDLDITLSRHESLCLTNAQRWQIGFYVYAAFVVLAAQSVMLSQINSEIWIICFSNIFEINNLNEFDSNVDNT